MSFVLVLHSVANVTLACWHERPGALCNLAVLLKILSPTPQVRGLLFLESLWWLSQIDFYLFCVFCVLVLCSALPEFSIPWQTSHFTVSVLQWHWWVLPKLTFWLLFKCCVQFFNDVKQVNKKKNPCFCKQASVCLGLYHFDFLFLKYLLQLYRTEYCY